MVVELTNILKFNTKKNYRIIDNGSAFLGSKKYTTYNRRSTAVYIVSMGTMLVQYRSASIGHITYFKSIAETLGLSFIYYYPENYNLKDILYKVWLLN